MTEIQRVDGRNIGHLSKHRSSPEKQLQCPSRWLADWFLRSFVGLFLATEQRRTLQRWRRLYVHEV